MTKQVYYADKVIIFTSDYQTSEGKTLFVPKGKEVGVDRLIKALDDTRVLTVYSPDIKSVFSAFCKNFTRINAAGGVVVDNREQILMIRRRGFWDLPKGHREEGENDGECALREVAEECGLDPMLLEVEYEVARTLHFYWFPVMKRWEMKLTVWYRMTYAGDPGNVKPQLEEDITDIEWFTAAEARKAASESYKTIQEVLQKVGTPAEE